MYSDTASNASSPDIQGTGTALSQRHWKSADAVRNCNICGLLFTLFKKKHHCRHCGDVVCSDCCKHQYKLEDFGGVMKQMRVCKMCSDKYEADKEHPLYVLLGDKLGEHFFYTFMKNGDDDVDQICGSAKDRDHLEMLFDRNKVPRNARSMLADRIQQACTRMKQDDSEDDFYEGEPPPQPQLEASSRGGASKKPTVAQMLKEKAALEQKIKEKRAEYKETTQRHVELIELRNEVAQLRAEARFNEKVRNERIRRGEDAKVKYFEEIRDRKQEYDKQEHSEENCEICRKQMKKLKRHHCRICYRAVCGTCSTAKQEQHRICDWCHVEHTFETKAWLTGVAESPAFRSYWSLKLEKLSFDLRKMDEPNKDPAASNGSAGARTGAMSSRSDATDIEVRALDLNLP